jgi:hypothetical protein
LFSCGVPVLLGLLWVENGINGGAWVYFNGSRKDRFLILYFCGSGKNMFLINILNIINRFFMYIIMKFS